MLKVTLVNLENDARRATAKLGRGKPSTQTPEQVRELLEQFRVIDTLQNHEADPEILLESRRSKRIIRQSGQKLFVYNPSLIMEPAYESTAEAIVTEMEQGVSAFWAAPVASSPDSPLLSRRNVEAHLPLPLSLKARIVLAAVAVSLICCLTASRLVLGAAGVTENFEPITDPAVASTQTAKLIGVYMTGEQPGEHGLAFDENGGLKAFELTSQGAPHLIRGDYRVGRIKGNLCVVSEQLGEVVWVRTDGTLGFGRQTYRRIH